MKNKKIFGSLLLLLAAMIWGTAFAVQRAGMEKIEPMTFNAARMALAAAAVGTLALLMQRKEKRGTLSVPGTRAAGSGRAETDTADTDSIGSDAGRREYNRNSVIGGICCGCIMSVACILQQMGLVYTTAGKAGFITAMYILLVPIISVVFLKKKNTWIVWAAVLLGAAGMYFLCVTEDFRLSYGDSLVSICALFFSFHILCCDYFVKRGDPIRISAMQFVTAAVVSSAAALIMETPELEKMMSAMVPILYCGLISGGVGYTLQLIAQKHTDPTVASLLMSMEAVFAVIAGALLLHEHMSLRELSGCVIMFAAIVLVQLPAPGARTEA